MTYHPLAGREVTTGHLYQFLALGAVVGAAATAFVGWLTVAVAAGTVWVALAWLLASVETGGEEESEVSS